jgi:hypothetical protein
MISLDDEEQLVIVNCVKMLAELKGDDVLGLFLRYSISKNGNSMVSEQKLIELTHKLTGEWPSTMEH